MPDEVDQSSESFDSFTDAEKNIHGLLTAAYGATAPWMSGLGACFVKIYGIRRKEGKIEFGVGNEKPPILAWVGAEDFFDEWPQ